MSKSKANQFDLNNWLISQGYKQHPKFPEIAKLAARRVRDGVKVEELQKEIEKLYPKPVESTVLGVKEKPAAYTLFQNDKIRFDSATLDQFKTALSMQPIVGGALMPDAHYGYGVPIGAVMVSDNAIFPSYVGVDIGCRMTMSVLDVPVKDFMRRREKFMKDMINSSKFGPQGYERNERHKHSVMDDVLWKELPYLKALFDKAWSQLGTSGGGNHFFDAAILTLEEPVSWLPEAQPGDEFAVVLTHSGSRGVGKLTEEHYDAIAVEETKASFTKVPKGYAWLDLSKDSGREYRQAMELMGRYAQANHHLIHDTFLENSGLEMLARIENHHNFAWIQPDGKVIHRKGATPAGVGEFGIVPGSCAGTSFVIEGLGNPASFNSSSHGAGRAKSRSQAKAAVKQEGRGRFEREMKQKDILHFGIADDETDEAYKNPEDVMAVQDGVVVKVVGRMKPVVVVMGEEDKNEGK